MSAEMLQIGLDAVPHPTERARSGLPARYPDCRPNFLHLSQNQLKYSKDHEARPVMFLTETDRLPWLSGFAETINGGKSPFTNEDHAAYDYEKLEVVAVDSATGKEVTHYIELWYFGVFDGHAGCGASIFSSKNLQKHIISALRNIGHLLIKDGDSVYIEEPIGPLGPSYSPIPKDTLVRGAMEQAFIEMDAQIARERATYSIPGGCTAVAAVLMMGKLYVANAGDSRAMICREAPKTLCANCSNVCTAATASEEQDSRGSSPAGGDEQGKVLPLSMEVVEMSHDFTPETDRCRLQYVALLQPKLLRGFFGRLEWQKRLRKRDVDKRVMCRDAHMQGWMFRTVTEEDLSLAPMITGEGKRSRLLGTIGTSRGFGDHDLVGPGDIHIKPFLTPAPEVIVYDLSGRHHTANDVLIIATDGLWERLNNEEARDVASIVLAKEAESEPTRYISLAKQLVLAARGNLTSKGWRTAADEQGSYDDITVFAIPLGNCPFNPAAPAVQSEVQAVKRRNTATEKRVKQEDTETKPTEGEAEETETATASSGDVTVTTAPAVTESTDTVVAEASSAKQESGLVPVEPPSAAASAATKDGYVSISPNPSIDSEMVVVDSLMAKTTPSVEAGVYHVADNDIEPE